MVNADSRIKCGPKIWYSFLAAVHFLNMSICLTLGCFSSSHIILFVEYIACQSYMLFLLTFLAHIYCILLSLLLITLGPKIVICIMIFTLARAHILQSKYIKIIRQSNETIYLSHTIIKISRKCSVNLWTSHGQKIFDSTSPG